MFRRPGRRRPADALASVQPDTSLDRREPLVRTGCRASCRPEPWPSLFSGEATHAAARASPCPPHKGCSRSRRELRRDRISRAESRPLGRSPTRRGTQARQQAQPRRSSSPARATGRRSVRAALAEPSSATAATKVGRDGGQRDAHRDQMPLSIRERLKNEDQARPAAKKHGECERHAINGDDFLARRTLNELVLCSRSAVHDCGHEFLAGDPVRIPFFANTAVA